MSVKEIGQSIIVTDCLDGKIIDTISIDLYDSETVEKMIIDILYEYVYNNEHGVQLKLGYKP